jgi:PiT family inorganic phosphate transporter
MSTVATAPTSPSAVHENISKGPGFAGTLIFIAVLLVGISYIRWSLSRDLANPHVTSVLPYFLLGLALFVALGFEFVNGFHDTANAEATVIYSHHYLHAYTRPAHRGSLERLL